MAFFTELLLEKHIRQIHGEDSEQVQCELCSKNVRKIYLPKHIKLVHENQKDQHCDTICDTCGKELTSTSGLKIHIQLKHRNKQPHYRPPTKEYKCDTCGKLFYYEKTLKSHNHRFHEGIPLTKDQICDICAKSFYLAGNFQLFTKLFFSMFFFN